MTTATADLATMTPPQIDTLLAELWTDAQRADAARDIAVEGAHHALEETKTGPRDHRVWPTTAAEAIALCREAASAPDYREHDWKRNTPRNAVQAYDKAIAAREAADAAAAPYAAEYLRRRWSRFFLVVSSDGHIHSSMNCKTCYTSTEFSWLPNLSGLTEADAVAAHGPLLCSVCYPSAPAEWTKGRPAQTAAEAEADGKCINREGTNYNWRAASPYGDCPACGARGVSATNGGLRKHTHERLQLEAERNARLNDPKLIGTPAGDVLKVAGDVIRTVRTAEIAYVDAMWWAAFAEKHGTNSPARVAEQMAKTGQLLEALAAKAGTTPEDVAARLAPRVAKKLKGC